MTTLERSVVWRRPKFTKPVPVPIVSEFTCSEETIACWPRKILVDTVDAARKAVRTNVLYESAVLTTGVLAS